jgi:CBS domain-containing protein
MAGQAPCCLTPDEWCRRFEHWMAHGSGNDLLAARIYFDLRPLAGRVELADPVIDLLRSPAAAVPRFVKQMADVVLCNHVPLNWFGGVMTMPHRDRPMFDLKMHGTALFVDAARLWALAFAIADTGTVPRLRAAAARLRVPAAELATWLQGFLELQRLRLVVQRRRVHADADPEDRTWVAWDEFDAGQRQVLKRALRAARWVQQRIELDYRR